MNESVQEEGQEAAHRQHAGIEQRRDDGDETLLATTRAESCFEIGSSLRDEVTGRAEGAKASDEDRMKCSA